MNCYDPASAFYTDRDDPAMCPYCDHPVDEIENGALVCADPTCGGRWASRDDMERERGEIAAGPFYGN